MDISSELELCRHSQVYLPHRPELTGVCGIHKHGGACPLKPSRVGKACQCNLSKGPGQSIGETADDDTVLVNGVAFKSTIGVTVLSHELTCEGIGVHGELGEVKGNFKFIGKFRLEPNLIGLYPVAAIRIELIFRSAAAMINYVRM